MKVLVFNGSPKGNESLSFQNVRYIQKVFPNDIIEVVHVGKYIKKYEKDFCEITNKINNNDFILFVYPVYTFIAPYQLHRFIELLKENKIDLSNKYVSQITTSKHFYDVTAHKYIEENASDFKMHFIKGFSADMEDLLTEKGQKELEKYWEFVRFSYYNKIYEKSILFNYSNTFKYTMNNECLLSAKDDKYSVVVVTNCRNEDEDLKNMINDFVNIFPYKVIIKNILDYNFLGGCLGCLKCASSGICVYKDGFNEFLKDEIQNNSSIVYAFRIKDHSMGSSFKLFDDRQFCNGHRTVIMGMPVGYIVSGNIEEEKNLKTIIEGRAEVGHNYLAGIGNDSKSISNLSKVLAYSLENKLLLPTNFYGVGGMKIFRDLIYVNKGFMNKDHKFYKKHKFYDFPQKEFKKIIKMKFVGLLLRIPNIQTKIGNKMDEAMIAPFDKVINNAQVKD